MPVTAPPAAIAPRETSAHAGMFGARTASTSPGANPRWAVRPLPGQSGRRASHSSPRSRFRVNQGGPVRRAGGGLANEVRQGGELGIQAGKGTGVDHDGMTPARESGAPGGAALTRVKAYELTLTRVKMERDHHRAFRRDTRPSSHRRLAACRERGPGAVSVKDVAAAASVSRQLVYYHYRNGPASCWPWPATRTRPAAFAAGSAGRALPRPRASRRSCASGAAISPACCRRAGTGGGVHHRGRGRRGVAGPDGELREACRLAVEPVAAGRLAPGWTADSAADWAWARIQPSAWAHLVGMRGWDPAVFTKRTVTTLLAELVAG